MTPLNPESTIQKQLKTLKHLSILGFLVKAQGLNDLFPLLSPSIIIVFNQWIHQSNTFRN